MTRKFISESIKRIEDPELITGRVQFLDDIELPDMLHAAFKRSDYAHARIKSIDVSEARNLPGVIGVWTAADFGDYIKPGPLQVPPPTAIKGATYTARTTLPIAIDKIRYSGEPVAIVLAENRYIAEDALDLIYIDSDALEVVGDLEEALKPDSPLVHEDTSSNEAGHVIQEKGDYASAAANADLIIKKKFHINRVAGAAMENRGIVVQWDDRVKRMTIWCTTQSVIALRNQTAQRLGLFESQVRVITPNMGGGFGPKINTSMPDDVLITYLAMKVNRPIKWVEDRRENFLATTSERDQVHYSELAVKKDGTILGLKDVFFHNTGAYNPYMMTVPLNTQSHTISNYRVPNFRTEFRVVFTNQMIVTPVRGAGRQYGVYVMERMLDAAAKELKMDPLEIRKKNLIRNNEYPVFSKIIGQDFVEGVLDSGDYPTALEMTAKLIEYEKFRNEIQPDLKAKGRRVGIGVACFTEGTGVGPYEGAKVTVGGNGKVTVSTGYTSQGQGQSTTFAQIVADQLGVDVNDVKVILGDTGYFSWGAGTFASRGIVVAGSAAHLAAKKVREKTLDLACMILNAPVEEIELADGMVRVAKHPDQSIPLGELAARSNPQRGTMEPGTEPGLEAVAYYGPPYGTTGAGAMALILEVDPETMQVKLKKLAMVHDCGVPVNPMIVEGQLHGGIQMGIGDSFYEELIYDENGQLLTASFMDYLFPQATDMPEEIVLGHIETPSPLNPIGVKGVGEAGAIPLPPVFAQAIEDALPEYNLDLTRDTLSPSRLWEIARLSKK
ncbi:MAG: xanthine dehydrogenase family protein molybdopterin-binding subunit [Anaerolineaceae bacterium]|nr:xanthine dehydrogenase family protein molybdopterin-binding subunit [Anaerolineaceae bacterium]